MKQKHESDMLTKIFTYACVISIAIGIAGVCNSCTVHRYYIAESTDWGSFSPIGGDLPMQSVNWNAIQTTPMIYGRDTWLSSPISPDTVKIIKK